MRLWPSVYRAGLVCWTGVISAGCAPEVPPNWEFGGSRLELGRASWATRSGHIELYPDGRVEEDGDLIFVLDRVGRVVDDDYDPVALLDADGHLIGPNNRFLGRIGVRNAAPPWSGMAWLRVQESGVVTLFGDRAQVVDGGTWNGCEGAKLRACTLVSHVVALSSVRVPRPTPVFYGGIGTTW